MTGSDCILSLGSYSSRGREGYTMNRSRSKLTRWIGALFTVALVSSYILGVSAYAATCPEKCCDFTVGMNCCNAGAKLVNDDCGVKLDPNPGMESQLSPSADSMALAESPEVVPFSSSCEHHTLCDPPATRDDVLYLHCSLLI